MSEKNKNIIIAILSILVLIAIVYFSYNYSQDKLQESYNKGSIDATNYIINYISEEVNTKGEVQLNIGEEVLILVPYEVKQ